MDPTGGKAGGKAVSCAVPNANDPESKDAKRIIEFLKEKENSVYIFERMQEDQVRGEYFLDAACLPHTRVSWQEFNAQSVPVPPVCSGDPASFDTMCSLLQASFKENGVNLRFVDGNRTQRLGTDINTALTMTREVTVLLAASTRAGGGVTVLPVALVEAGYILYAKPTPGSANGGLEKSLLPHTTQKGNEERVSSFPSELRNDIATLNAALLIDATHPVLEDVKTRLADVHGVSPQQVNLIRVFEGSSCFEYTVLDLPQERIFEGIRDGHLIRQLRSKFDGFLQLKIHPLFFRCDLDINLFDQRGHKKNTQFSRTTFSIGPPNQKAVYTPPSGYCRFGLEVLDKPEYGGNAWLEPFSVSNPNLWWRAFHGVKNAQGRGVETLTATERIVRDGFLPSRTGRHGPGMYCSPDTRVVQPHYAARQTLQTIRGAKTFEWMFPVAVKPDPATQTGTPNIWRVRDPRDIRAYGLLMREV